MRFLAVTLLIAGAEAASAQPAPTPEALANVYACAQTQADAARLACYDEAVGRLRQAETQGQIVAVDRAQVASIERESFGFTLPSLASLIPRFGGGEAQAGPDGIEMEVARIIERPTGRLSFVMADGQIWTQVEAQRARNVRAGDTVTVRRAALGSFVLLPPSGAAAQRVRREN